MQRTLSRHNSDNNSANILKEFNAPKTVQFLFLLYIFVKPFYIFESGSFQPGDMVFVLAFAAFLYYNPRIKIVECPVDYILLVFLLLVALINFIYFSIYVKTEFMKSTLYYLFNFMFVIVARYLVYDIKFIRRLFWVCRAAIYLQVVVYFAGLGRYYEDAYSGVTGRYMGTLNDPNQLAFFVFSLLMIMFVIEKISDVKEQMWITDYAAFILILFNSSSTGMLLAFVVFGVSYIAILLFSPLLEKDEKRRRSLIRVGVVVTLALIIFLYKKDYFIAEMHKSELFARLFEKENLTASANGSKLGKISIWQDRNIDKLYIYPIYNLFGAGQGYFGRFWKATSSGEVHSTILSILFCYGIIPTTTFIYWCYKNVQNSSVYFFPAFAAIIVESITLLNQRQPTFWLLFVLAYAYRVMEDKKNEDAFYT